MKFSIELQEKINLLFPNNKEIREKLLAGDADAIRQIGSISQRGMNPEDIVDAFESNNSDIMDYLYKKAKKLVELKQLYKDLCIAYSIEKKKEKNDEKNIGDKV